MKKRIAMLAGVGVVVCGGIVFAASGVMQQSQRSTTQQAIVESTGGTVTTGESSPVSKARSVSETPSTASSKTSNELGQSGQLVKQFDDAEYESTLEYGKIDYNQSESKEDYDEGKYSDTKVLDEYSKKDVEFVSYMDQELTAEYPNFILTNLSTNVCDMDFLVSKGSMQFAVNGVKPGESETIDLATKLGKGTHKVTVVSWAVDKNGHRLNSVEQDVKITVKTIPATGAATGTEQQNQKSDSVYQTGVVYDAKSMLCTVKMPAALKVAKGAVGTDFDVSYRLVGVEVGTRFEIAAKEGLDTNSAVKLIGTDGGTVESVTATVKAGETNKLGCTVQQGGSALISVGPVHCYLSNNKVAKGNFYGTTTFKVGVSK